MRKRQISKHQALIAELGEALFKLEKLQREKDKRELHLLGRIAKLLSERNTLREKLKSRKRDEHSLFYEYPLYPEGKPDSSRFIITVDWGKDELKTKT